MITRTYPSKCPNCGGTGLAYMLLGSSMDTSEVCKICKGTGQVLVIESIPLSAAVQSNYYRSRKLTYQEWMKLPKREILQLYFNVHEMLTGEKAFSSIPKQCEECGRWNSESCNTCNLLDAILNG